MALGAAELYLATAAARVLARPFQAQRPLPHTDLGYYLARAGQWINAYIEGPLSGEDSLTCTTSRRSPAMTSRKSCARRSVRACRGRNVPAHRARLLADRADQLHPRRAPRPPGTVRAGQPIHQPRHRRARARLRHRGAHLRRSRRHERIRSVRPEPARLGARRQRLGLLVRGRRRIGLPALPGIADPQSQRLAERSRSDPRGRRPSMGRPHLATCANSALPKASARAHATLPTILTALSPGAVSYTSTTSARPRPLSPPTILPRSRCSPPPSSPQANKRTAK